MPDNAHYALRIKATVLHDVAGFISYVQETASVSGLTGWIIPVGDGAEIAIEGAQQQVDTFVDSITKEAKRFSIAKLWFYLTYSDNLTGFTLYDAEQWKREHESDRKTMWFASYRELSFSEAESGISDGLPDKLILKDGQETEIAESSQKKDGFLKVSPHNIDMAGGTGSLFCDATNPDEMEQFLQLASKFSVGPIFMMFQDADAAAAWSDMNAHERHELVSWRNPAVLLRYKAGAFLPLYPYTGFFYGILPYLPQHYRMFGNSGLQVLAMVSFPETVLGQPVRIVPREDTGCVLISASRASVVLPPSEVFYANGKIHLSSLAKGYTPVSYDLPFSVDGLAATGIFMENGLCAGKANRAFMIPFFCQSITPEKRIKHMYTSLGEMKVKPAVLAGDPYNLQHTDALAKACNASVVHVPGHHAHFASAMAMNEPDREVIGVLFGSENPGDDGNLWGGDFFTCTLNGFQRISHLDYLLVPKNERTETYPEDAGLFLLCQVFGREVEGIDIPFTRTVDSEMIAEACEMLHDAGALVMSTSAERLAGAVAAVTGICTEASFLGEPLLRLTTLADQEVKGAYTYEGNETIAFRPLVEEIVQDIRKGLRNSVIAAKFINTLIDIICDRAEHIRKTRGLNRVVLAGEIFQNPLMLEKTTAWLRQIGFEAFSSTELPAGYGGLLPGRLAVAAKMR